MTDGPLNRTGFDLTYLGTPPWDIGRPQTEFAGLADAGKIVGDVLDIGCGTGEHALFIVGLGHPVLGVDTSPNAISKARAKAEDRGSTAEFMVADALNLGSIDRQFDTVIDSGVFHVFDDAERVLFADSLGAVLRPQGHYFMLVFSDREPPGGGPRRITRAEIRNTFAEGFEVESIEPAVFETNLARDHVEGWLADIRRL